MLRSNQPSSSDDKPEFSRGFEGSKLRVLLVDDDDTFCTVVNELVETDGDMSSKVDFSRLSDGADALDYLRGAAPYGDRAKHPWPHLVLLDQRMPKVDGTEALRILREDPRVRATPVCMLSSSDQDDLVREAYELGANFYFVKPYKLEELQTQLRRIVEFFSHVALIPEPDATWAACPS